ncbi:signal peptidase II [Sporichthya sp.]|uniref:signal peptidase II n=1 Tax=Sporichthya sp. TaxID=65475 RepID=UPI0017C1CC52|nr:signal peptidase II [Sporichthya sp.]MBA3743591.1 signal peptidase II [Sporichthya sp.]
MSETVLDPGPVQELLGGHAASPRLGPMPSPVTARARHAAPVYVPPVAIRRHRLTLLVGVGALTYLLDLVTKIAVVALLQEDDPVQVDGTGISLRLIRNPGAAFGLGVDLTALFTAITLLVVAAILTSSRRLGSRRWALTLGLLLGGALGNLTDRLARSPGFLSGHVVDFVEIPGWPIFNVADLSICVAGAMMVALAIRNIPLDGRRPRRF